MWHKFAKQLNLDDSIVDIITNQFAFDKITKVQHIVIREFINNTDVIVKSLTGSGKTLSYLIPLFQRLIAYAKDNSKDYINQILALIILPSRELSTQVYNNLIQFTSNLNCKFSAQLLIGGKKVENDIKLISQETPNIIVATPGRLLEIKEKELLSFSSLQLLILDEADRMLDMGFENEISFILSKLPKQKRVGLFSATVNAKIENLIKAGMRNPFFIDITINTNDIFIKENELANNKHKASSKSIGSYYKVIPFTFDNDKISNLAQEVPAALNQYFLQYSNIKYKIPHLIQILSGLLNSEGNKKIIIFFSNCACVDYFSIMLPSLFEKLKMNKIDIYKLHSKINQNKREKEYNSFKTTEFTPRYTMKLLLTTDLSERGIDVPDVDMIIQYDPPKTEGSYIHKVGRTARVGNTGVSLIFLSQKESVFVKYMETYKQIAMTKFELFNSQNEIDNDQLNQMSILSTIKAINLSDKWIYDKAVNSFISYLRFYQEIKENLKHVFDFKNLDLGNLANSFQLVKLPRIKMKEFSSASMKNFISDPTIEPKDLVYKDKNIKMQMDTKKEKILKKLEEINKKKGEKEEELFLKKKTARENYNNNKKQERTRKEKKESKFNAIRGQWDDLAYEEKMYKKYKQGKLTKEEYDKILMNTK